MVLDFGYEFPARLKRFFVGQFAVRRPHPNLAIHKAVAEWNFLHLLPVGIVPASEAMTMSVGEFDFADLASFAVGNRPSAVEHPIFERRFGNELWLKFRIGSFGKQLRFISVINATPLAMQLIVAAAAFGDEVAGLIPQPPIAVIDVVAFAILDHFAFEHDFAVGISLLDEFRGLFGSGRRQSRRPFVNRFRLFDLDGFDASRLSCRSRLLRPLPSVCQMARAAAAIPAPRQ